MGSFPDEVRTAGAVVITGPPKTGGYPLFHRLLADRDGVPVVIATASTAGEFRDHHAEFSSGNHRVRVVDCVTRGRGADPEDDAITRYVDSPGNLTALGVKITELLEALDTDRAVIGVHSISQLLMHAGVEQTYQFIHILAQQAAAEGHPFVAVLNERAHDDQTVNAIFERFDCIVETREGEDGNEFRARSSLAASDWRSV